MPKTTAAYKAPQARRAKVWGHDSVKPPPHEAYWTYAAVTKDAAQRSIRTFYAAVRYRANKSSRELTSQTHYDNELILMGHVNSGDMAHES